jgi:hypothetical protein
MFAFIVGSCVLCHLETNQTARHSLANLTAPLFTKQVHCIRLTSPSHINSLGRLFLHVLARYRRHDLPNDLLTES